MSEAITVVTEKGVRHYHIGKKKYVSVTTPLGIISIPWLKVWEARVGKTMCRKVGARASSYGTKVHALCDDICLGKEIKPTKKYKKDMAAFKVWFDENVEEVVATEQALWSDEVMVAGRVDFIGRIKGRPGLTIVDWKTGRLKKEHFLQLAAYAKLAKERGTEGIEGRLVVRIKEGKCTTHQPKGGRNKTPVPDENLDRDWEIYKNLLNVYRWYKG